MGQQLSHAHEKFLSITNNDTNAPLTSDAIISHSGKDDILTLLNAQNPQLFSKRLHTKQIQNHLFQLTNSVEYDAINREIYGILFENVFKTDLASRWQTIISEVQALFDREQKLQIDLTKKIQEEKNVDRSIFHRKDKSERPAQQLPYFAIQSLTSVLLILIKSAEKHDPTIVQQILTLASELCEQLPTKCLSSVTDSSSLVKTLRPLTTYINDLLSREDPSMRKQATKILLCFGLAKNSLKDILPIVNKLIFQMDEIYDAQGLLMELNNNLIDALDEFETKKDMVSIPLEYLKSIGVYPTDQLMKLDDKKFTGHLLASAILAHIDIDHIIHADEHFSNASICSTLFLEFHYETFQQLFHLIQQSSSNVDYILTVCLRLFTTHLKYLCAVHSTINGDILTTNHILKDALKSTSSSQENFDWTQFATNTEFDQWYELLLKLACSSEKQNPTTMIIAKEASQGLVFLLDQKMSFLDKLSFIYRFILDNKYPTLIECLWTELSKTTTLLCWIEVLVNEQTQSNNDSALTILYSFIDMYFKPPVHFTDENKQRTKDIVHRFQELLFFRLGPIFEKKPEHLPLSTDIDHISTASSLVVIKYLIRILNSCLESEQNMPTIFSDILAGLYLMSEQETGLTFFSVQPIFVTLLPLLADHMIRNKIHDEYVLSWLLGRMSTYLIASPPKDALETKHVNRLDSLLFMNGCEPMVIEKSPYLMDLFKSDLAMYTHFQWNHQERKQSSSSDDAFLLSIYHNQDQGAKLISKMKLHQKNKQRFLPKSIQQFVNDACAAIFAVYIKHYRRIYLAKSELVGSENEKPHEKLLSIYDYASRVQTIFSKTKAQGGDCNDLFKRIQTNALFLLVSVKENSVIPIVEDNLLHTPKPSPPSLLRTKQHRAPQIQRQESRWTKAKAIIRLLRISLHACTRLKKLMISKKQSIEQKYDPEQVLHRLIDDYVYEDKQHESDELMQCLCRQHERAMTRLVTYLFNEAFLAKIFTMDDHSRALSILALYLPQMRHANLVEWTHAENIQACNNELKDAIAKSYYACIHMNLSHLLQSLILIPSIFHLLNLSYRSLDIHYLDHYQVIQTLCKTYVNFADKSDSSLSLKTKLTGYTWFRLFVYKLCDNIQEEQAHGLVANPLLHQQRDFIFRSIIIGQLQELKRLKQTLSTATEEDQTDSLSHPSLGWFIKQTTAASDDIELCLNQFLALLLRCVHLYEHVRSCCATIECVDVLLDIYHHSQHQSTRLLATKVLRDIICFVPETRNERAITMMKGLFNELFVSIMNSSTEIITESINIYRTLMSVKSAWQSVAIQKVFDSIMSMSNNYESLINTDKNKWNDLVVALYILGGYLQPFGLGSIVRMYVDDEDIDEFELGLITGINSDARDQDSSDVLPYLVQYSQSEKSEWNSADKLFVNIDVLPPNLLSMYNENDPMIITFHAVLDTIGSFLQIPTSPNTTLLLLQLKRYAITVIYRLLNNRNIVEIFMEKPYASVIAQLALGGNHLMPNDLRLFNRQHLEQYCLSLDRCVQSKTIVEKDTDDHNESFQNDALSTSDTTADDSLYVVWNTKRTNRDQSVIDALSASALKYGGWKANASEIEIELYKQGRHGSETISIVSIPRELAKAQAFEECGNKQRFNGRIDMESSGVSPGFPTFTFDNLQLSEGKWYYCVRLPAAGLVQIGWATAGFKPDASDGVGVGDDEHSWSYDGSRSVLFHNGPYNFPSSEVLLWKENDVCGCGIEIDKEITRIKYWLNGKFLGTAFTHTTDPTPSRLQCNMKPNGRSTTYFPCVTLQLYCATDCCELIVSAEDMDECPIPAGYKPLLTPNLVHVENSIVAYPYSAYLVGDDIQDYLHTSSESKKSASLLRDFVNEHHLETTCTLDNQWLVVPENSGGLPVPLNPLESSWTISFDVKLPSDEDSANSKQDLLLLKFDQREMFPISISSNASDDNEEKVIHVAIVCSLDDQQTKVYLNDRCRTFIGGLHANTIADSKLFLLPNGGVRIRNLGRWKYALSEEHIRRLFLYGLFYVAADYHEQQKYRKQANTFSFSEAQPRFSSELLVPFNKPFEENHWVNKKKSGTIDSSNYFTFDDSSIQLFGNKTYLVLDISGQQHSSPLILILDVSIPKLPIDNEQLTLVVFTPELRIILKHTGHLGFFNEDQMQTSDEMIILNEFVRLLICLEEQEIKVYQNATLMLSVQVNYDQIRSTVKHIDLFRELDLTKNTTNESTLRLQCKSITFRSQPIAATDIDMYMKSPMCSLEPWLAPPFSLMTSSLVAIGYKATWIKLMMEQHNTRNLQHLDTFIREQEEELSKKDQDNQRAHMLDILFNIGPSIDQEKLKNLITFSKLDIDDDLTTISELIFNCWQDLQRSTSDIIETENDSEEEMEWFYRSVRRLGINGSVNDWMQDKSKKYNDTTDSIFQLLDLTKPKQDQNMETVQKLTQKSLHYSHQSVTKKQYLDSRIACEHGLIMIYAREIILNILQVWSTTNQSNLFPWEKFGDYTFILKLMRLLDSHSSYASTRADQLGDRMNVIIKSILQLEIGQLLKQTNMEKHLEQQAPLLYHLQKDFVVQSIRLLENPSLLVKNSINEQTLNFLLKIVSLFSEIVTDQSSMNQNDTDKILPILFSDLLITLIFDLFLLVPTHQVKICILRLFANLIQASDNFKLRQDILYFLSRLFIQLSSDVASTTDHTLKQFSLSVTNIIYLLILRKKKRMESTDEQLQPMLALCLKAVRNLFTVLDVIHTLQDRTKQAPWPEAFLALFDTISNEDLNETKIYFNETADLQLLNLINKKLSSDSPLTEIINCLPMESESTAGIYQEYPLLSNIPGKYVRARATLFGELAALIAEALPAVDLSLSSGQSNLLDQFRQTKIYLFYILKSCLLQESLEKTIVSNNEYDSRPSVQFDTLKASQPGENGENTMFNQAFEQLFKDASVKFRRSDEHLWHATYVGMHSIDAGGPYRDSITCICSDICSTRLSLFILCPNGRTGTGSNQDRWIPNVFKPTESISSRIRNQYRFVGQLMGMAIRQKHYLDLKFSTLLWKQLVRESIVLEDIEAIDIQSFTIIKEMEMQIEQSNLMDNDVDIDFLLSSVMSELRFEVVGSAGQTYELISGGKDIPITATNFKDYCRRFREYRLNEFSRQINYIRQGLYSIVPSYYLSLFTARELEQAVCGNGHIDIELLKRNTDYSNEFREDSPHIQRFWTVLKDMFNEEQRKAFLIFVWGRSTLPMRDEDFTSRFHINPYCGSSNEIDRVLPQSHTCSFAIDLPEYSTTEIMYERLNYAVTYCSSIDAD
ncbi:unnamed protein product [Adineta steineri]|uniref:Uncharacterized protein n=1 Tax=Adineta steineri TaxID=433720 RepID=A0A815Y1L7_9BILA|nr:unnamed protein product [Adineta steineri]CAF1565490.1 unnamed protein product [Adineta steineri]